MGNENKSSMYLKHIELHEVLDEIKKILIKKAKGYDNIAPKIIKWASDMLAPILQITFNKCIKLGYYPDTTKKVVPMEKLCQFTKKANTMVK